VNSVPSAYFPPVQIDQSGVTLGDQDLSGFTLENFVVGPWSVSGVLYIALMTGSSSLPGFETPCDVWLSTDNGATWAVQDHSHAPLGTSMMCSFDGSSTISVSLTPETPNPTTDLVPFNVKTFDCTTNKWGLLSAPSPLLTPGTTGPLAMVPLLSGSLMIFYQSASGTVSGIIFSGAWGTPFPVDTHALAAMSGFSGINLPPFFVLDSTGNVHTVFELLDGAANPHLFYQLIGPTGTLLSFFEFPGVGTALNQFYGIPTIAGANVVFPVQSTGGRPGVYIGTPLSGPSWTLFPDIDPLHIGSLASQNNSSSIIAGVVQVVNAWPSGGYSDGLIRVSSTTDFLTWVFTTVQTYDLATDGPAPFQLGGAQRIFKPLATAQGLAITSFDLGHVGFVRFWLGALAAPTIGILCGSPPAGLVGTFYSHSFPVTGDTPPDVFAITAGFLPTGLGLNTATGLVSGIPLAAGVFGFTIQVTDSTAAVASVPCSITITSSPPPPPPGNGFIQITFRGVKRTKCEPVEPLATLPPVPHVKRAM
jgi:hypothetical protein